MAVCWYIYIYGNNNAKTVRADAFAQIIVNEVVYGVLILIYDVQFHVMLFHLKFINSPETGNLA